MIKKFIKKMLFGFSEYIPSFSIGAEDLVLMHLLQDMQSGFYVDIGAFHPEKHSNTFALYRYGWSGINIDAMPGVMQEFSKQRPRDINLEIGVAEKEGMLDFFIDSENGLFNGFDNSFQKTLTSHNVKKVSVKTKPLAQILVENLPKNRGVDLLMVDVEGLELTVLASNNWEKFRPRVILIEDFTSFVDELPANPCVQFLLSKGYRVLHKTPNGIIFLENSNKLTKFNRLIPN